MTKSELRAHIRALKQQFTPHQLQAMSAPIIERLLNHERVKSATTILMYYALNDEVHTATALDTLVGMGKTILLPRVIDDENMAICRYQSTADLRTGAFGIMEPIGSPFTALHTIDLCVVPGMSFDSKGNRLGRGKGYYDRFLRTIPQAYKIGVCFPFQKVDNVPHTHLDIHVDEVI